MLGQATIKPVKKEKGGRQQQQLAADKQNALTRVFTPYCFSTFSRSCLKQASKRSWKGLSASVTFSPWMRTPSARCGIWWDKTAASVKRQRFLVQPYPATKVLMTVCVLRALSQHAASTHHFECRNKERVSAGDVREPCCHDAPSPPRLRDRHMHIKKTTKGGKKKVQNDYIYSHEEAVMDALSTADANNDAVRLFMYTPHDVGSRWVTESQHITAAPQVKAERRRDWGCWKPVIRKPPVAQPVSASFAD